MKNKDIVAGGYEEVLAIDTDIYPRESIFLAACGFIDEAFFYMFPDDESGGRLKKINVAIRTRAGNDAGIEELTGRFTNELNRQSLRIALDKMNRKVRTEIVGRALASALSSGETESQENA